MAIYSSIMIRGSVGAGGQNGSVDVMAVQQRLNDLMRSPRVPLAVDGRCGPKTCAMIGDFQKVAMGLRMSDSRVDPNGRTLAALNDPQSESLWARQSLMPPGAGGPSNLSPIEQQRLQAMRDAIARQPQAAPAMDFLAYISENEVQTLKMLLNMQGAAQFPVEFFIGIGNLRRVGFSAREIATIFSGVSSAGSGQLHNFTKLFELFAKPGRLASTLKSIGNIATVVQIMATAAVVIDHFRAGRYGPAFAEIYATGMGMAIPWAGFLNAMQELLYAANPAAANDSRFQAAFRLMLACDPIGAGKTAVDTVATFAELGIKALFGGKINGNEVDELVRRMRNSPMRFWTEIGDSTGEWMGDKFGDWYYRHFLS